MRRDRQVNDREVVLRPPPRLRPLTHAVCEAGLGALGLPIGEVLGGRAPRAVTVPAGAVRPFLEAVLEEGMGRVLALPEPLVPAAASNVAAALLEGIAEAARAADEHRRRLVAQMAEPYPQLFAAWRPDGDGRPLRVRLAAAGPEAQRALLEAWPLADLLVYLADCEVAAFYDELDETVRQARRIVGNPG